MPIERLLCMVLVAVSGVVAVEELQRMLLNGGHGDALRVIAGAAAALASAALMSLKIRKENPCAESSER